MKSEMWADIKGFEGYYSVSSLGNIYSHRSEKMLSQSISKKGNSLGRKSVVLSVDGKTSKFLVHRLVAEAFIPNPQGFPQVNHIDENPSNNIISNLEWCDAKYNHNYGTAISRRSATNRKNSKTLIQKSLDGVLIKEFECVREAEEAGFKRSHIIDCCRGRIPTSQGFIWEYGGGKLIEKSN